MTDQELKELVASLAVAQKETDRLLRRNAQELEEFRRMQTEANEAMRRETAALKTRMDEFRRSETEANEAMRRETAALKIRLEEFRRSETEANEAMRSDTRELKIQLGGLGNKFGDFAEGMAFASLVEILAKRFGAELIHETRSAKRGEDEIELDMIGSTNGRTKRVIVAEVKSALDKRELEKFVRNLKRFVNFFPYFKGYRLYGVLAAVAGSKEMETAAFRQGVFVARMHGDTFRLKEPTHFRPKDFSS